MPRDTDRETSSSTGGSPTLRILVVEDNEINRRVARKIVEHLGHQVYCVSNGAEALDVVRDGDYDLVLMDCQMPVMDGFAATKAIRQLPGPAARLPIIAMTAHSRPDDDDEIRRVGMDDFLTKPIVPDVLAAALARYLP